MVRAWGESVHNMNMAEIAGTQVVGRVALVLRTVSTAMPNGLSTTEVATRTGLARPTAHRLLSALASEGFLDHDPRSGRWLLGPELYIMGTVAAERYDITELARDSVRALAVATGESAFFSARRGDETVCLLREDGSFPVRSHVLYEGVRFPLGVASAGIVILSFLPDRDVEQYLARHDLTREWGDQYTAEALRGRVARTRAMGYAVNPGLVVEGSWGMAAAVFDNSGRPAWALSLTGIESRFAPPRQAELGRLLLKHAHRITQGLSRT